MSSDETRAASKLSVMPKLWLGNDLDAFGTEGFDEARALRIVALCQKCDPSQTSCVQQFGGCQRRRPWRSIPVSLVIIAQSRRSGSKPSSAPRVAFHRMTSGRA
ncbi:hypothetical protein [Agrobacterium radiobacter]|uniref:hypothetical protein n=1 Tax=Agrobacterium radiobacter TaxID=362 RepID=UPI003CE535B5